MHRKTSHSTIAWRGYLAIAVLGLFACDGDDPAGPDRGATQLAFLTELVTVEAGTAIDPAIVVEVRDASGRRAGDAELPVTLSLGQSPDGAGLSGTKTVRSAGGVASFSGLSLDSAAAGYTLTARADNLSGAESAPFEVMPGPPASIAVSPEPARLNAIGDTLQLEATVHDRLGNAVTGVPLTGGDVAWSSADPDVASVDASGRAVAVSVGETTVSVETVGVQGEAPLEVDQIAERVVLTPAADTVAEGETVELLAMATDSNGVEMSDATFDWSSEAPVLATVVSTGPATAEVEGLRGGTARVTASVDEQSGEANIEVLRKVAFASNRNSVFEIWVANADGSDPTNLTRTTGSDSDPAWSPDGAEIAFTRSRDEGRISAVWIVSGDGTSGDGSEERPLADDGDRNRSPAWSPDGERIAFVSRRNGRDHIYVMNDDGSDQTDLTDGDFVDHSAPIWSPDGSRIAFLYRPFDENREIYVMNADGTEMINLSNSGGDELSPAWSPDGTRIAFVSRRDGNHEVYVVNADGTGEPTNLTDDAALDRGPAWSPAGDRIAFWSDRDGGTEIYVMDTDGGGVSRLTNNRQLDRDPVWSPDRASIAFLNEVRDGQFQIQVVKADGSGQVTILSSSFASSFSPEWRPDPLP